MNRARAGGAAIALALALSACAHTTRTPPIGVHSGEEGVVVPFPPPPGHVEVLPARPRGLKRAVWVDGQWLWKGRRWLWQSGEWTALVPGSTYAPPKTVRLPDKTLAYYPGVWKVPPAAK